MSTSLYSSAFSSSSTALAFSQSMVLVEYSDSDEELEEQRPLKRFKSDDVLPSLPTTFLDLYSSTVRSSTRDDPSLHGGRTRAVPHVEGNWSAHIYIEWYPSEEQQVVLSDVIELAQVQLDNGAQRIHSFLQNELGVSLPLHISLSAPLILTTDNKDSFSSRIQEVLRTSAVSDFNVQAQGLRWHINEEGTRNFLVIQLAKSEELAILLQKCNAITQEYSLPSLYTENLIKETDEGIEANKRNDKTDQQSDKFHVSIAWALPSTGEKVDNAATKIMRLPASLEDRVQQLSINITEVKLRIGQTVIGTSFLKRQISKQSLFC